MPEMTPYIGLKKPLESETADITVINENMDKIDSVLGDLTAVPTTAKDTAGAITELHEAIQEIDVDIPEGSITPAKLSFDPATQTELDAHANATSVHGATNAPAASRLIIRDAAGRAKVAAPAASDDIARLDSITKAQVGLSSVDNYATANQAQAEAGTASNLFMTPQRVKQYTDKRLLNNIIWRINAGQPEWSADGTMWNGVGEPVYKNPFITTSTINLTTSNQNIVTVSGKKGAIKYLTLTGSSVPSGGAIVRIIIDGATKFAALTTSSTPYISLTPYEETTSLGTSTASGSIATKRLVTQTGGQYENLSLVGTYPYVDEINPISGYTFALPTKIRFDTSLTIQVQNRTYTGGVMYTWIGYETE